jgi:membrane-bound metal-dependent hydrolase YbcI (DUF457 family)
MVAGRLARSARRQAATGFLMFTGHFAVALAGAGRAPRLPLGLLIAAAFAGDLIEAVVAAFNVIDPTRVLSHSLPATALAGAGLGAGWRLRGGSWTESAVIVLTALSHTALDFVTGYKTWFPGLPPFGLRLYSYPVLDYVLELAAIGVGWSMWRKAVPPGTRTAEPVWLMLVLLVGVQTLVLAGILIFGPAVSVDAMSKFVR